MKGIFEGEKTMLKKTTEGYVYNSSKTSIEYALLEGVTIGGDKQYTSDIIFIILTDPDYNVDNNVVGYLFGADIMKNDPEGYEESIAEIVNEFEQRNNL